MGYLVIDGDGKKPEAHSTWSGEVTDPSTILLMLEAERRTGNIGENLEQERVTGGVSKRYDPYPALFVKHIDCGIEVTRIPGAAERIVRTISEWARAAMMKGNGRNAIEWVMSGESVFGYSWHDVSKGVQISLCASEDESTDREEIEALSLHLAEKFMIAPENLHLALRLGRGGYFAHMIDAKEWNDEVLKHGNLGGFESNFKWEYPSCEDQMQEKGKLIQRWGIDILGRIKPRTLKDLEKRERIGTSVKIRSWFRTIGYEIDGKGGFSIEATTKLGKRVDIIDLSAAATLSSEPSASIEASTAVNRKRAIELDIRTRNAMAERDAWAFPKIRRWLIGHIMDGVILLKAECIYTCFISHKSFGRSSIGYEFTKPLKLSHLEELGGYMITTQGKAWVRVASQEPLLKVVSISPEGMVYLEPMNAEDDVPSSGKIFAWTSKSLSVGGTPEIQGNTVRG